jgi:hypothetical protein
VRLLFKIKIKASDFRGFTFAKKNEDFMDRIFRNWKTSVAGLVLGTGQYLMMQGDTGFTWESFASVVPTLLLGLFAGDKAKR